MISDERKAELREVSSRHPTRSHWLGCDELISLLDEIADLRQRVEAAERQRDGLANFNPDWDMLEATQDSLREHMAYARTLEAALQFYARPANWLRPWKVESGKTKLDDKRVVLHTDPEKHGHEVAAEALAASQPPAQDGDNCPDCGPYAPCPRHDETEPRSGESDEASGDASGDEALGALSRLADGNRTRVSGSLPADSRRDLGIVRQALRQQSQVPDDREDAIWLVAEIMDKFMPKPPGPSDGPFDFQPKFARDALYRQAKQAIEEAGESGGQQSRVPDEIRAKLREVHSTLDELLGDSDADWFETDERMKEQVPLQWAAKEIAALIYGGGGE